MAEKISEQDRVSIGSYAVTVQTMETDNEQDRRSRTDERAERQVENTSAGGHLGGTYFGQEPDGKTSSATNKDGPKARQNDGRN